MVNRSDKDNERIPLFPNWLKTREGLEELWWTIVNQGRRVSWSKVVTNSILTREEGQVEGLFLSPLLGWRWLWQDCWCLNLGQKGTPPLCWFGIILIGGRGVVRPKFARHRVLFERFGDRITGPVVWLSDFLVFVEDFEFILMRKEELSPFVGEEDVGLNMVAREGEKTVYELFPTYLTVL